MIFTPAKLPGVYVVDIERRRDDRGYFARSWCQREFESHGLETNLAQINVAHSPRSGTLRGLHFQVDPDAEVKLVRCLRGAMYDVIVDLRPDSPTYGRWQGFELTAEIGRMIYVPEGFAHGYQTLLSDTEMCYHTSQFYAPASARGIRFNDPAFKIRWSLAVSCISHQDETWADWSLQSASNLTQVA